MQFRTPVKVRNSSFFINHHSKILSVGSCFADMIGECLLRYKFNALANPFGNIFNPVSIFKLLSKEETGTSQLIENHGNWFSYDWHSEFAASSKEELNKNITKTKKGVNAYLGQTDVLILTFGTAWVYKLKETNTIVANCHKMPAGLFEKYLLSPEDIVEGFTTLFHELRAVNPSLKVLLTVSPVRHIKDTIELNSVSKSVLRVVCHTLSTTFDNVFYFPAYEILMDDLRDYRFYKKDMIHPNEIAEEYVWKHFMETYMDESTRKLIAGWDEILAAMKHKPFQIHSAQHQQFVQQIMNRIKELNGIFDVQNELDFFRKQLVEDTL